MENETAQNVQAAAEATTKIATAGIDLAAKSRDLTVIEQEQSMLADELQHLEQAIHELKYRLAPILTPELEETIQEPTELMRPVSPIQSPLANQIATASSHVAYLRTRVTDILERLEL